MDSLQLPARRELFELDTPAAFQSVAAAGALEVADAGWWESLIAACNYRLMAAEPDVAEVREWADALLAVLAAALQAGQVRGSEVLRRKAAVKVALLETFGRGNADLICAELLYDVAGLGEQPDRVSSEILRVRNGEVLPRKRIAELQGLRQIFLEIRRIREQVADQEIASALDSWCAALNLGEKNGGR